MLESVLIKPEHMNLPRFRISTIERPSIIDSPPEDTPSPERFNDDMGEMDQNQGVNESEQESTVEPESRSTTPELHRRKRGRPRVHKHELGPKIRRGRGRPKKHDAIASIGAPLVSTKRIRSTPPSNTAPIPLTKTNFNHTQRPLFVDIDRLRTADNRDRRQRLNTLDVLKHLVKQFEPIPSQNNSIKPQLIQQDFKTHLLDHLNHLSDVHGSIDDLNFEINSIQKQKQELRAKIFDLKNSHSELGNKLNTLRDNYQSKKSAHEEFLSLATNIDNIKKDVQMNTVFDNDVIKSIDKQLNDLGKVFNPYGLNNRLRDINKVLTNINNDII